MAMLDEVPYVFPRTPDPGIRGQDIVHDVQYGSLGIENGGGGFGQARDSKTFQGERMECALRLLVIYETGEKYINTRI